jgi:hypothetical protein
VHPPRSGWVTDDPQFSQLRYVEIRSSFADAPERSHLAFSGASRGSVVNLPHRSEVRRRPPLSVPHCLGSTEDERR